MSSSCPPTWKQMVKNYVYLSCGWQQAVKPVSEKTVNVLKAEKSTQTYGYEQLALPMKYILVLLEERNWG